MTGEENAEFALAKNSWEDVRDGVPAVTLIVTGTHRLLPAVFEARTLRTKDPRVAPGPVIRPVEDSMENPASTPLGL